MSCNRWKTWSEKSWARLNGKTPRTARVRKHKIEFAYGGRSPSVVDPTRSESSMKHGFVHVSDIHFGQEKNGSVVIHDDVRKELISDVASMAKKRGSASRVLVTGDIAYSGTRAQYETAVPWLEELTKAAQCAPQEVSCIPGNHDCDLSVLTNQAKLTYEHLRGLKPAEAMTQFHAIVDDGEI